MAEKAAWLIEKGTGMWDVSQFTREGLQKKYEAPRYYLGTADGEIFGGFILIEKDTAYWPGCEGDRAFYFHKFMVTNAFAGKGCSRKILDWVKAFAERSGKDYVRLDFDESREYLRNLYYGAGFECVRRLPEKDGERVVTAEYRIHRNGVKKEICIDTWDRKEHFKFFSSTDLPFYNTNFTLDITGVKEKVKEAGVSLNTALIYTAVKALLPVANFRYRYENGSVFEYDELIPSFTHIKKGESLFRFISVNFSDDLRTFDADVRKKTAESDRYFDLDEMKNGTNFVFISSLPWIPFTGIDHTLAFNKYDAIPRITWGKYYADGTRTILPYNIQVNHMFVDGLHVGRFYENLIAETARLVQD